MKREGESKAVSFFEMDFSDQGLDSEKFQLLLSEHDPDDDDRDSLDASENVLDRWPSLLRFSKELRFLSLACNAIVGRPDEEDEFPVCEYLHLFKNSLTDVSFLARFPNLSYLNLHSNPIVALPVSLPPLLVYLNLSHCELKDATPVFSLSQLQVLNMSDNHLIEMNGLERLVLLTSLELQKNDASLMVDVPPRLKAFGRLQILNLDSFRSNNTDQILKWIELQ